MINRRYLERDKYGRILQPGDKARGFYKGREVVGTIDYYEDEDGWTSADLLIDESKYTKGTFTYWSESYNLWFLDDVEKLEGV